MEVRGLRVWTDLSSSVPLLSVSAGRLGFPHPGGDNPLPLNGTYALQMSFTFRRKPARLSALIGLLVAVSRFN